MPYACQIKISGNLNIGNMEVSPEFSKALSNIIAQQMFDKNAQLIAVHNISDAPINNALPTSGEQATILTIQMELEPFLVTDIPKNKQRILERIEIILRTGSLILTDMHADGHISRLSFEKHVLANS